MTHEKIKTAILNHLKKMWGNDQDDVCGIHVEDAIVWLENQDKHSIYNVPSRDVILAIWDLGNEWKELTNGCISTEFGTQLDYIQKHWEESEYYLREKQGEKLQGNSALEAVKKEKIEPKFHVGDLVVDNYSCVWKIEGILNQFYILECPEGGESRPTIDWVDRTFHLWTIQDAKNGDVLASNKKQPFIFNGHYDEDTDYIYAHCGISDLVKDNSFYCDEEGVEEELKVWCTNENVFPATKEQCDLLFQKMKEAGYEWDADNKELKKKGIK